MASGNQTTSTLGESFEYFVAQARVTREYEGVMSQLVDKVTLDPNTGLTWNEISLDKLTASAVAETQLLDNPQMLNDTKFPITPTVIGIEVVVTDRVKRRISRKVWSKMGQQTQDSIQRKKDQDLLVTLDGASTSLPTGSGGGTLTSGVIAAAAARIAGNTTEPGKPPFACVLHPYQVHDLFNELVAGVGTYPLPQGDTATVLKNGFKLPVAGVDVFKDGNLTIDSSDDAKGGVFAKEGIVLVQGKAPWQESERKQIGGGADVIYHYDEYGIGERLAGGSTSAWVFEVYTDATAPSS